MKNNRTKIIVWVFVGIVILGTAAFVGGRLLNNKSAGVRGILNFGDNSTSMTSIEMEPSPLLPKTDALVNGTFSERKDNIILVQTVSVDASNGGGITVAAVASEDVESGEIVTDFVGEDGPKVEVVVTKDSVIYNDVTEFHYQSDEPTQQELELGSLDDLSKASIVTVWGRKVGDRIIADVFVIYNPSYVNVP
jgi:hypothetical protein